MKERKKAVRVVGDRVPVASMNTSADHTTHGKRHQTGVKEMEHDMDLAKLRSCAE